MELLAHKLKIGIAKKGRVLERDPLVKTIIGTSAPPIQLVLQRRIVADIMSAGHEVCRITPAPGRHGRPRPWPKL